MKQRLDLPVVQASDELGRTDGGLATALGNLPCQPLEVLARAIAEGERVDRVLDCDGPLLLETPPDLHPEAGWLGREGGFALRRRVDGSGNERARARSAVPDGRGIRGLVASAVVFPLEARAVQPHLSENALPVGIATPRAVLEDLSARLVAARLPLDERDTWEGGMNPSYLRTLVGHWRDTFDWRAQEELLNRFRHFRTEIDGTRLHLIHEMGRGPAPMPLLLTHGYPDSFFRFHKLIPLLTNPAAHGGDADDAFHVVVPSLPGYGFSDPREKRDGLLGFSDLWYGLMTEGLGYARFGAHGGDWGGFVTEQLARGHAALPESGST